MSSEDIAIKVEGLGKCYQIYNKPSDRLRQFVLPKLPNLRSTAKRQYYQDFWALQDVSFEVKRGDTVGLIGRNGSGKSTLLQIICGTLTPSVGKVEVAGRVAALLELGAGFNPEFTGRENVYLNAALFGLSSRQTDEKFDAIASFADIGPFIDQPVKTYSSGMYVRLAFAVIAHVDADILIVDEALSVGDAVFTQKCMRFIRRFQERGTLLFVSHDLGAVQNLCASAVWMGKGRVLAQGPSKAVVEQYTQYTLQETYGAGENLVALRQSDSVAAPAIGLQGQPDAVPVQPAVAATAAVTRLPYSAQFEVQDNQPAATGFQSGKAHIESAELSKMTGEPSATFEGGERVRLRVVASTHVDLTHPIIGFFVKDRLGQELFGENTLRFTGDGGIAVAAGGSFNAEFVFQLPMLPDGQYALTVAAAHGTLADHIQHHWIHDIIILNVVSSTVRWGLVGVPFEHVALTAGNAP